MPPRSIARIDRSPRRLGLWCTGARGSRCLEQSDASTSEHARQIRAVGGTTPYPQHPPICGGRLAAQSDYRERVEARRQSNWLTDGVRLSCGALKKEWSFNILRASRLARLLPKQQSCTTSLSGLNWMLDFRPTVNAMPEKVAQFVET